MRLAIGVYFALCSISLQAQPSADFNPAAVLTKAEWEQVNDSVDRALAWLATRQQRDGSFPTLQHGQPGVTGLVVLAYLTQGHLPGEGEYGDLLDRSIDYIAGRQKQNGLLAEGVPDTKSLNRAVANEIGVAASYNHAIAGLVLSETYAMAGSQRVQRMQPVIEKALEVTFQMQDWPKHLPKDEGGWRYLVDKRDGFDSDLSVTGWQLMFLRSAKNAGFDIESRRIERAISYVRRTFEADRGTFTYKSDPRPRTSRGMAGAGILALAHSGMHDTEEAQRAGDWILRVGFDTYNSSGQGVRGESRHADRYFYGLLTCSQAMYQLGDNYWSEFFPRTAMVLVRNQNVDGSWESERLRQNGKWGSAYTTAIGVIALNASNQLLPIFQR